ncbi:MAG: beta-galactosidase [Pseudonocardiales bacterium]|nr:beta-galactosidase [Pseudonocardiales bacterium]
MARIDCRIESNSVAVQGKSPKIDERPEVGSHRDHGGSTVTATTGTSPDGQRVHVVHNWSGDPVEVTAPVTLTGLLDGGGVAAGGPVQLGVRDVRVFVTRQ